MEVKCFPEKLNKVTGHVYTVEEEIALTNGVYEAELKHDNINVTTLTVYTGQKLTGDRIETYTLSTPSLAPWKRIIRIHATVPVVYLCYETDGDIVEADDINLVQEEITKAQIALNEEKNRAEAAENRNADAIAAEEIRAKNEESIIRIALEREEIRATAREMELEDTLQAEIIRAETEEQRLSTSIAVEKVRAEAAEGALSDALSVEKDRAVRKESDIEISLSEEAARAKAAEATNKSAINAEALRAEKAESTLYTNLEAEITRARAAEDANTRDIAAEAVRAKAAETTNANNIASETTRAKAKEAELQSNIDTNMSAVTVELNNRYTKDRVYTKDEVLAKIEELIGAAPDTLDTFKEIADALGNDPNFAATIINALSGKVDKEVGKGLSTNDYSNTEKAALADADTKKHTHSNRTILDKITQTLLDNWSAAYNNQHTHENKSILDTVTQTLVDRWNAAWNHISDSVAHITSTERSNWTDAYNKRHEHSNKSILDSVTQTLIAKWNEVTNKVDKIDGKGLSTNDYTTIEKNKLAGLATGAEIDATYIKSLSVSGKTITITWGDGSTNTITTQDTDTDTKNTAGSTNSTSKLFLIGAASQAANPQTYSRSVVYIGTDGCLYSNGVKVSVEGHTHDYVKKAPTWGDLMGV